MKKRIKALALAVVLFGCWMLSLPVSACAITSTWHAGFGRQPIIPDENSPQPLYIAGYNSGWEATGVLDPCEARAVWLDTGAQGVLIIGVDCVALDSGTVAHIREALQDLPNCAAVHVYATHTHAGPDTLGLWGPTGINGKNDAYMESLIQAAAEAGRAAARELFITAGCKPKICIVIPVFRKCMTPICTICVSCPRTAAPA